MCLSALFAGQKNILTYLRRASSKAEVNHLRWTRERERESIVFLVEKDEIRSSSISQVLSGKCREEDPSSRRGIEEHSLDHLPCRQRLGCSSSDLSHSHSSVSCRLVVNDCLTHTEIDLVDGSVCCFNRDATGSG